MFTYLFIGLMVLLFIFPILTVWEKKGLPTTIIASVFLVVFWPLVLIGQFLKPRQ
jgi:hypothetical protein